MSFSCKRMQLCGAVAYCCALHDVSPDRFFPAALAEVQQVVYHDLAYQIVSGEAVEVIHRKMQLPGM